MDGGEHLPMMGKIKEHTNLESDDTKTSNDKTTTPRSHRIILALLIIILTALVVAVIGLSYTCITMANRDGKLCTTEKCLRSATSIVEAMNKSVDPCDDFYQFACGRFGNMHPIPKSSYSTNQFTESHNVMMIHIRDFMEKKDAESDPYSVTQARLLYRSCVETDKMDASGLTFLVQILDRIGLPRVGFTANDVDEGKNTSLTSILANVKKQINYDYLFTTNIAKDSKNRNFNRVTLGKPKDSYLLPIYKTSGNIRKTIKTLDSEGPKGTDGVQDNYVKLFKKYFNGVWMEVFKYQSNSSGGHAFELEHAADKVLAFTKDLDNIKDHVYDTDGQLPLVMRVDELQVFTDKITHNISGSNERILDWKEYLTILLEDYSSFDFETDFIQVNNIEYFEALFKMLVKTDNSTSVLNIWWEVVTTLLPYTTNQMRFVQNGFFYETTGLENNPSRSLYCANAVNTMMGLAVSQLLLSIDSLDHNIEMVTAMMKNIHWSFEQIVNDLTWMDETTKNRTLDKAKQLKTLVGYPEIIKDPIDLDAYFNDLEVKENDFFNNVIFYAQLDLNNTLLSLESINDFSINAWASNPLEVNACNGIQTNTITVPAGILQFPFFGHDLQVLNYGYLGTILGHELTHSFDNTGRKYDQTGNEITWWTNHTTIEYEKRTDCFVNHYESYLVPGISKKVNGKLTLDENIADNGGIREALLAYKKFVADNGEELKLPGLENFSNEQVFFLAFAHNWCEASTNESLSRSILDEHSPNYLRVLGGLTNSEEFSEVWKCEKGSKMNPANDKCKIW